MKSRFNIAICFSGQARCFETAAPYIKRFLGNTEHNIKFFCHTWSHNSWKTPNGSIEEDLNKDELEKRLRATYDFEALVIDTPLENTFIKLQNNTMVHAHSISPFKSAAIANHLKNKYEMQNEIVFDIVFKLRLDIVFLEFQTLSYIIESMRKPLTDEVIINASNSCDREFRHPWCEDMCYYGSSLGMDIISDLYFYYANGKFFEMANCSIFNPAITRYGPNAQLYKWATMKNLKIDRYDCPKLVVYPIRHDVQDAYFPDGYKTITERFLNG